MAYTKYSLTPADNNAAPPNGAPEGMLPSGVNDTMRDMMSQIRDVGDGIRDGTYTMTAPKITGGTITGAALTGNTFTSPVISGGSINNTPIGASTASTGAFSALSVTGATTFSGAVVANTFSSSGATITGGSISGITDLAVADGGTGASTLAANNVLLGNGTSALQTVAPSTSGNFLRSNGTTWISEAVSVATGTVTSVATGNGLSGGTITTTGTLVVACPGYNTVGSYALLVTQKSIPNQSSTYAGGSNYAVGTANNQVQAGSIVPGCGLAINFDGSISGTWKWMGPSASDAGTAALGCRVS
jgi:hypothetical protein